MQAQDWHQVCSIYVEGIATGLATFETEAPDWPSWDSSHLTSCRLVARTDGSVIGWAALSPVSSRCVYGDVAEVSVYVSAATRGKGVGKKLLDALVAESERNGIWTLQAGILTDNSPSIALHKACGFRVVGVRERLGKLRDVWRDVVVMERRSGIVGKE